MITRRDLLKAGTGLSLPWIWLKAEAQGNGKKKGHHKMANGLLNGLALYCPMLSVATLAGRGPLTNGNGVTFSSVSPPVSGEGIATFNGSNWLQLAHGPDITPTGLFLLSVWFYQTGY